MVHLSVGLHFSSDGSQPPGSLRWSWVARWYWCEHTHTQKKTVTYRNKNTLTYQCSSPVSLLVFLLQSLLQVLDWAGDRGEGAGWAEVLELLLHVNILELLLLSDGCHLLDLFLCRAQRLTWSKEIKWDNYQSSNDQNWSFWLKSVLDSPVLGQLSSCWMRPEVNPSLSELALSNDGVLLTLDQPGSPTLS